MLTTTLDTVFITTLCYCDGGALYRRYTGNDDENDDMYDYLAGEHPGDGIQYDPGTDVVICTMRETLEVEGFDWGSVNGDNGRI